MLDALTSGTIGGFASDVGIGGHPTNKPSEPWDPHDELSQFPNVLFTPHVGGYTDYSYSIMAKKVVDSIEHIIRGEPPPVWVNKSF
jgi:phosphoglycerate dehydrogenase-like enzyme